MHFCNVHFSLYKKHNFVKPCKQHAFLVDPLGVSCDFFVQHNTYKRELEIWLPHRNFDLPDLPMGPIPTEQEAKRGAIPSFERRKGPRARWPPCMTGRLHWVTGGTRLDESFATSQLPRKQAAHLASNNKRAVQTIKRLRSQPDIGLRFGPLSTKMCVVVHADSALYNADADTDDEGSDDEWLARAKKKGIVFVLNMEPCVVNQDDLEKIAAIPMSFMTWKNKASKRTILITFGAEASACRDALETAENTRAMLCEVLNGARVLLDEWTEEHLPIRVITDCKSLFDCLATDASAPEDRGAGVFMRNAPTSGTAQLHEESTKVQADQRKQLTGSPREARDVSVAQLDLEQKERWQ